jgi:NADP-dependent 3-hydroxy acid dehydrogenase YdfG
LINDTTLLPSRRHGCTRTENGNIMKMQDLTGKVAAITLASGGIGEATARLLVEEGVHVVLVARRVERRISLAAELGDSPPWKALTWRTPPPSRQCSLGSKNASVVLTCCFNNAGIGISSTFDNSDPSD